MLLQSIKGRTLRASDDGLDNERYEVPSECPLSVSHIIVLLMYCNNTKLQYEYKKMGCRERDSKQTLNELKGWNREIAHWHRLLIEVVYFWGDRVSPNQVFYTGLNIMPSFNTFSPEFNCPFSTTISLDVAKRFSGEDQEGVILKLMAAPGSTDRYFDVEWISSFFDEKERLFVKAQRLIISDIRYFDGDHLLRNDHYLTAFRLFSSLFCGHFISPLIRSKKRKERAKTMESARRSDDALQG